MPSIRAPTRTNDARSRRRRATAKVAAVAAFLSALPTVVLAEGLVCVAESCTGTYAAVGTTGDANSSSGVAVSGGGSSSGVVEVEATRGIAEVDESVTGTTVGIDNTGDAHGPLTPAQALDMAYSPAADVIALKEAVASEAIPEIHYQLAAGRFGLDPTLADRACPDGTCYPRQRTLSQWLTYQQTSYWCGPASTQIVLAQLGLSASQSSLAGSLNTSKNGTTYQAITRVLNERTNTQKAYFIYTELGDDPASYMSRIVSDVEARFDPVPHGIVNNVRTDPLDYWGDKSRPAWHFNVSHGYSFADGGYVNVAEVYDPTKVGSNRRTNPYGHRTVPLDQIYRAVMNNKRMIIW